MGEDVVQATGKLVLDLKKAEPEIWARLQAGQKRIHEIRARASGDKISDCKDEADKETVRTFHYYAQRVGDYLRVKYPEIELLNVLHIGTQSGLVYDISDRPKQNPEVNPCVLLAILRG